MVRPENIAAGKVFGARHRFKVCTGACYLWGYIRDNDSKHDCLRERTLTWEKEKTAIKKTAGKYPQEIYAAVVRAIQPELIFLQHITWYTVDAFPGVDKMIRETFLPGIFLRKTKTLSPIVGAISTMTAKKDRLGLLNPVDSAQEKYLSSQWGEHRTRSGRDGGRGILQFRPPTYTKRRKTRRKERPGFRVRNQTQGFSL